jgi:hypothetical protein
MYALWRQAALTSVPPCRSLPVHPTLAPLSRACPKAMLAPPRRPRARAARPSARAAPSLPATLRVLLPLLLACLLGPLAPRAYAQAAAPVAAVQVATEDALQQAVQAGRAHIVITKDLDMSKLDDGKLELSTTESITVRNALGSCADTSPRTAWGCVRMHSTERTSCAQPKSMSRPAL